MDSKILLVNHRNLKHISGWQRCSVFATCLGTVFRNDVKMVDIEIRKYFPTI